MSNDTQRGADWIFSTTIVVGCISLFIYDFFITLCSEIRLIWDSPRTMIKVLFLIQRYLPFVDVALVFVLSEIARPLPPISTSLCWLTPRILWRPFWGKLCADESSTRTWVVLIDIRSPWWLFFVSHRDHRDVHIRRHVLPYSDQAVYLIPLKLCWRSVYGPYGIGTSHCALCFRFSIYCLSGLQ
jgi:hypothetical protein